MSLLRRGDKGSPVKAMQLLMGQVGFQAGVIDGDFGPITEAALVMLQKKYGLAEDGIYGPRTKKILEFAVEYAGEHVTEDERNMQEEAFLSPALLPQNALDLRLSNAITMMQTCDDGQGCRYGGWINPYQFEKEPFKEGDAFPIPLVGKVVPGHKLVKPIHGGTCSPWAGLFLGWYLCANEDFNFRIGRSARWMTTWPHDKVYKGKKIPGYGDYAEVEGKLRLEHNPLNNLYGLWDWLYKINIVEMEHHIVLILKVGGDDGLHLADPNTGQPLPCGLYRLGADGYYPRRNGSKYYSGTKQTFKRVDELMKCTQKWDVYRVKDVDSMTCSPQDGPWKGRKPRKLTLEK